MPLRSLFYERKAATMIKIAVFSAHDFEIPFLEKANNNQYQLVFISEKLSEKTVKKAKGCNIACIFSSDDAGGLIVRALAQLGIRHITTRSTGFNHVDLATALECDISVTHVPEYSPNAIAEHCVALILALQRKLIPSYERIRNYNFSLNGLIGSELNKKTVGVMGTGTIGYCLIKILNGFGATILAFDARENPNVLKLGEVRYVDKETLYANSDVISLNLPLNSETENIINDDALGQMKNGVILVNAGRGKLVDTQAVIHALKTEKVGGFGMDVYEHEEGFFYEDHSKEIFTDDVFARLLTFKNVIVTAHQAFLTDTALEQIAQTTIKNIQEFAADKELENKVELKK